MHIKKKLDQHRRDFNALYACEHCGHEVVGYGYDDANFHANVIPAMKCPQCEQIGTSQTTTPDVPAHVVL